MDTLSAKPRGVSVAADRLHPEGISGAPNPAASIPIFGETVSRVVPDPHDGVACMLDFETGRLLVPPPEIAIKLSMGEVELGDAGRQWLRENSADGVVNMPAADHGYSLRLFEGLAITQSHNGGAALAVNTETMAGTDAKDPSPSADNDVPADLKARAGSSGAPAASGGN